MLGVLVVAAELGVNALERRVTVSLRLLDTVRGKGYTSVLMSLCIALIPCPGEILHVGDGLKLSAKTSSIPKT